MDPSGSTLRYQNALLDIKFIQKLRCFWTHRVLITEPHQPSIQICLNFRVMT
jgi:hypothetical protein